MGPRIVPLLAALALAAVPLQADVVTLDDGRVIEGEIVSEAGAPMIEVRTVSAGLVAVQRFEARHVVKVIHGPSPRQQALAVIMSDRAALGDGGEADQWMALARRAKDAGESLLAKDLAGEALARDRSWAEAHRFLGEARQNGVWMRPREAAAARGELFFRGRWVSWDEKEGTLAAEEKARQDAEALRRKLLEERSAKAALAAAEQTSDPQPYQFNYGYYQTVPRVLYWAPSYYGCNSGYQTIGHCPPNLIIHANGHAGNTSWSLNWSW